MAPPRRLSPLETSITRRTWLEWFGKATALSLAAALVGCDKLAETVDMDRVGLDAAADAADSAGNDVERDVATDGDGHDVATDSDGRDATHDEAEETAGSTDGDTAAVDLSEEDAALPEGWVYYPSEPSGGVYDAWPERTVDRQEITSILARWSLTVDGMVEQPLTLSFADLLRLPRQDQLTDLHCVEGWSVWDIPWNGVHLSTLLERVRPSDAAGYITFHTIDDRYNESLPLYVALEPKTLLAYGVDDATLPLSHGFPLRLVVPRLFGYKSAKYVYRLELTDAPVQGFWVQYGYGYDAEVPPERLREGRY